MDQMETRIETQSTLGTTGSITSQPDPDNIVSSLNTKGTNTTKPSFRICLSNTEGFIWDVQAIKTLRKEHRIVGSLIGSLPRSPMQNIFQGLPLRLLPEEIYVLMNHNIVEFIVDDQQQNTNALDKPYLVAPEYVDRALIFEYLWKVHQFFVAPGMKFGGDYLLYRNDPLVCHASLVASIKEPDEPLSLIDLVNSARLVSTVQKQHLLCSILSSPSTRAVTTTATTDIENKAIPTSSLPASNHNVVAIAIEWAGF
ncbi:hypothetical protein FBU30_000047 [Linnemannia zychae]|nr:hypothetical protein FBU30_000047 [Linnemannia zychae]